jgi:energy-converting hydrogenase Eha subunit G
MIALVGVGCIVAGIFGLFIIPPLWALLLIVIGGGLLIAGAQSGG